MRNALFRSLMEDNNRRARLKLREFDFQRRTVLGEMSRPDTIMQIQDGAITRAKIVPHDDPSLVSPEYLAALRRLTDRDPNPPPHPLLRWWRRLLWGE